MFDTNKPAETNPLAMALALAALKGLFDGLEDSEINEDMSLNDYQEATKRTQPKATPKEKLNHALFGLASEAGEAAGILQKVYQGHPDPFEDADTKAHLVKELGDALWMIAEAADALGVSLGYVASTNLKKLEARYPDGFDPEKSLHRKDDDV